MKVIDLLNKIANGEEVPKKIKWFSFTYKYSYDDVREENTYLNEKTNERLDNDLLLINLLNNEIEIIEDTSKEDKKIEKLDLIFEDKFIKKRFKNGSISYLDTYATLKMLYEKQCEIIDKINGE